MKRIDTLLMGAIAVCVALITVGANSADEGAAATNVKEIPSGYRDWRLISVAHEEGDLHSFAAVLGNDVAIKAFREGKLSFPDGTIIAALHYRHLPSEENNKVFGRDQSFVAGPPPRTSSLWSRTQRSMPRQAGGGSVTSKTANLQPTRR